MILNYRSAHASQPLSRRDFLRLAVLSAAGALLPACSPPAAPTPTALPSTSTPPPPEATSTPNPRQFEVLASGLAFPEGPAFAPDGSLYCTEMDQSNLIHLVDGKVERIPLRGRPNGLAFDRRGRAWVADSRNMLIQRYDPAAGQWETMAETVDGQPLLMPNDLCFDAAGSLLFTCPNFADDARSGYVCCLSPDGALTKIAESYYRPNGLEIVDGGAALVVADTTQKTLFKGAWDAAARRWTDVQPWAKVGGAEGPDGMAFGANGRLYQAIFGDGVVRVVNQDGKVVEELFTGGMNPTNVAIDPSGKLGLVVTETERGRLLSFPRLNPGAALFDGGDAWD